MGFACRTHINSARFTPFDPAEDTESMGALEGYPGLVDSFTPFDPAEDTERVKQTFLT